MVDGTATLMTMFWTMSQTGLHDQTQRGVNLLDTGAHFYDVYECSDGEYVSVGSIEPQFYAELMRLTGLADDAEFARQMDRDGWPGLKGRLADVFRSKTRDEWCEIDGAHRRLLRARAAHGRSRPSIRTTSLAGRSSRSAG